MTYYELNKIKNRLHLKPSKTNAWGLIFFSILFSIFSISLNAQVKTSIDSTSVKIGEQITYKIEVEVDTTSFVVFPEGQTFLPMEMIESFKIDTTKVNSKYNLIKKYGLTQFDSGSYTIPRQKIVIGDKPFLTDSLRVEIKNIAIDTTKQGLYDIKPIIKVEKSPSNWWKYLLLVLAILGTIAFLIYWFIFRKKPLTEEEEIALLPPYDRAKLALQKLDNSGYLENEAMKEYYSELTFIIRKYLDEKVYDKALESTTDELVSRLNLLKDGNQIELSKEDIRNIETILKRADLVKFAKSEPDIALAEIDRKTIDLEIDHVKEALPEPTEEEKLLDQQYKEEQERKSKRKKIILASAIVIFLMLATFTGFGIKYGFGYVKDTIIGHESKELLEGDWVTSDYGIPSITISTPKVLKRIETPIPDALKGKINVSTFGYGSLIDGFNVMVSTTTFNKPPQQSNQETDNKNNTTDLNKAIDGNIQVFEQQGVQNIILNKDKFTTPNGAEGVKTTGSGDFPTLIEGNTEKGKFTLFTFSSENVLQQIIMTWRHDDTYADQIVERMINSIELKPKEEE
ncbi:BatD family protein [Pontimicrobium sp. MEBiC06410]